MVEPVEGVAFNLLDRSHSADWRAVCSRFARDADDVKLATRDLVDTCFRRLRSVDAAAQLLHSFRGIQVGGCRAGGGVHESGARSEGGRELGASELAAADPADLTCACSHVPPECVPAAAHAVQPQGAMQQQMADKLAAVLEHFIREVGW